LPATITLSSMTVFLVWAGAVVALLSLTYMIMIRQLERRACRTARAEAAERERSARALHDTLLQGVQGLIFKVAAVAERLPPEKNRTEIESALDSAEVMLSEGHEQLIKLRRSDEQS
jgi:signal transduction histidine kinase